MYQSFKDSVLGTHVGDGECVSLIVNTARAYVEQLFPGVSWTNIIHPVVGAREMAGINNQYLTWIANDYNDPNQVPLRGDIMVFDKTPQAGYANTYNNPYGHTGICESADSGGYNLLQQNAPSFGQAVNVTHYSWKFRPCLGWLRPKSAVVLPAPTPAPTHTIFLPPTTGPWHLYKVGGPYNPRDPNAYKGLLVPAQFGGLTYAINADRANGIYTITSQMYGQGDLFTAGSYVVIQ